MKRGLSLSLTLLIPPSITDLSQAKFYETLTKSLCNLYHFYAHLYVCMLNYDYRKLIILKGAKNGEG